MKNNFSGIPHSISREIIGRIISLPNQNLNTKLNLFGITKNNEVESGENIIALITKEDFNKVENFYKPTLSNIKDFETLNQGDIVLLHKNGKLHKIYDKNSKHNSLFITGMCNSDCIMCSQPPINNNDLDYGFKINSEVIDLITDQPITIGITGGEPTLLDDRLCILLEKLNSKLPETQIYLLTNGRKFSSIDFAKIFSKLNKRNIIFSIPLHSDLGLIHDLITREEGSYIETINGIINLARLGFRVEIRIIIQKNNANRFINLTEFIHKNLTFVEHIAFMGLENIGFAKLNTKSVWIDPIDYINKLSSAVEYLDDFKYQLSIYNLPLCILPSQLHQFSRKSISEWKNDFIEICQNCIKKESCCGFFSSTKLKYSKYIKPFN